MIECKIYTPETKDKVLKPSQWKDDMYISLTWLRDDDQDETRCPHCERVQEHSSNVYDSGAPDYIMGFNCEFCGRFVELED